MPDFKNFVLHDGGDLSYGGGYDPTVTDYSSVHDGSGGPVVSQVSGCSYSSGTITSTGDVLENTIAGAFAYVVFTGSLSGYTDYYIVASRPDKNTITIVDGPSGTDNCNVTVGGFWPSTGAAFQQALNAFDSSSQLHIATDQASGTTIEVGTELATDTSSDGTPSSPISIIGVDKLNGTELNRTSNYLPRLRASANLANILHVQSRYYYIKSLHIDANGYTISNAGIYISDLLSHAWNCLVDGGGNCVNGISVPATSTGVNIVGCEVWGCTYGIVTNANCINIQFCAAHDCATGIVVHYRYGINVTNCRSFNNTADGIYYRCYAGGMVLNNVSDHNGGRGFYFYGAAGYVAANNSATNNGTCGYDNYGDYTSRISFSNNHSYNNASGHCEDLTTPSNDNEWADFLDGGNIVGDPKFLGDYTDGDYRVQAGSALLNAGWPRYWGYETDRDAVEVFGHVGAFVPEHRSPMPAVAGMVGSPVTGAF